MYALQIQVKKILGECTSNPPCKPGDTFFVRDGDIRIPEGGSICMWALQSMLPVITPKEREIAEHEDEDWMWRVHHIQCPDPKGRVIYKIERKGEIKKIAGEVVDVEKVFNTSRYESFEGLDEKVNGLESLRVIVEEVQGTCTSGMSAGDFFLLHGGRLYIPHQHHFCLYALHAVLPLLPAKQRPLEDGDWLKEDNHVICPDPAGNVIMRIETYP
jgi:uncharacterized repeat protein (TIGR04076 family)